MSFLKKFWKQLVRWLAVGAKEQLTVETDSDVYAPGKSVTIRATALAKDLHPVDDADLVATVTDPLGNREDVPMEWTLSDDGVYEAQYTGRDEGDYRVDVRVNGWDLKPVEAIFAWRTRRWRDTDTALKEDALKEMAADRQRQVFQLRRSRSVAG